MLSIIVTELVDGTIPSTIYLFPMAANKPPTAKPNLGSTLLGLIKKTQQEMVKATSKPVISLNNISHEFFLASPISILKQEL